MTGRDFTFLEIIGIMVGGYAVAQVFGVVAAALAAAVFTLTR